MDAEELEILVVRAREGDLEAFVALVRRFQDMAVGYAYSRLGDFHLAEDAAQEAFVGVYQDLHLLREPAAFLSWFRRIISTRCSRYTRRKRIPTVPLDAVGEIVASGPKPDEAVERQDLREKILEAIQALPEAERTVMTLFTINGYPQKEIGEFLDVPVTTVKNRLRSARNRVHERMEDMVRENLEHQRPSRNEGFEIKVMADLARLPDGKMRILLDEVGPRNFDLLVATQEADDKVINKILANLEPWQAELFDFRMLQRRADEAGMREAREHILKKAAEVAEQADSRKTENLSPAVRAIREKLERTPFAAMGAEERAELLVDMLSVTPVEGWSVLEAIFPDVEHSPGVPDVFADGELLGSGMRLAFDGHPWELVEGMMETEARTLRQHLETRCLVVVDGVLGIREFRSALMTRLRMELRFWCGVEVSDEEGRFGRLKQRLGVKRFSELGTPDGFADALQASLSDRLKESPFSRMGLREVCHFFFDAHLLVQMRGGTEFLKELADAVDEDLPRRGLQLLIEEAEPDQIRHALEGAMRELLAEQKTRYRMSMAFVEGLQAGWGPSEMKEKMRALNEALESPEPDDRARPFASS